MKISKKQISIMKLLSLKKPVVFESDRIIVNDLARNYPYEKEGRYLVIKGFDDKTEQAYKIFYNSSGKFLFIKTKRSFHSVALLSWRQEYDTEISMKVDSNGSALLETSVYLTTDNVRKKLIKRSFSSSFEGEQVTKTFYLKNGTVRTEGTFPRVHFLYWI